jgi:hypothetical protein
VLLGFASGARIGAAVGPHKGKEAGEMALLREWLDRFRTGDVFVADRAYCSYWRIAALQAGGVDGARRWRQSRHSDFRTGTRRGGDDHTVTWTRPARPTAILAEWYHPRWRVEELHKGMKTGCGVEQLQFTTEAALHPTIALLSVTAVTLLRLRDLGRRSDAATTPAVTVVDPTLVAALCWWRWESSRTPESMTLAEFVQALGRLGEHQNRKHDGPPGWPTLWRGWMKLQLKAEVTSPPPAKKMWIYLSLTAWAMRTGPSGRKKNRNQPHHPSPVARSYRWRAARPLMVPMLTS